MGIFIFLLIVVLAVVILLWLITQLPARVQPIAWILQVAVVIIAIIAIIIRVFPVLGIDV